MKGLHVTSHCKRPCFREVAFDAMAFLTILRQVTRCGRVCRGCSYNGLAIKAL